MATLAEYWKQQQQLTTTSNNNSGETLVPIITFDPGDMMRDKIVEPAWYTVTITNIGEAPSKDGGSTNYPAEAVIVNNADTGDTKFANVPIFWNFNSKMKSAARGFLECLGTEVKEGQRYELASAIGKQVEVFVENGEWQGRILNRVNHKYRPLRG